MNKNSLIEIGSKANLVFRFKADTNINGQNFKKDEPFLFLQDANILVEYSKTDRTGETNKTLIANSKATPRSVMVSGVSLSRKIVSLLASYENSINHNYTVFETSAAESTGTIFVAETIDENKPIYVYDSNFDRITDFDIINDFTLQSNSFTGGQEYMISFSSVVAGTKFDLKQPSNPYLSLEIQGVGNIDKETKQIWMYFDKVSLNTVLEFSFMQDDMINVPLEFHIIDNNNNYVVFEE